MRKYMRLLSIFLLSTLTLSGYAQEAEPTTQPTDTEQSETVPSERMKRYLLDKVVAVVGGSSILLSDVTEATKMIEERHRTQGYTSDREPREEALEELMLQKLLHNQALIDSVEISAGDIAVRVEQQIATMSSYVGGVKELEKAQNMEVYNIREILRRNLEEQSYAQAMHGEIVNKVTIIPGEVEQYYYSRDRDSLPLIGDQIRYAQITRLPGNLEDAKRRVRERLLEMREKIISGESRFTSLARMYSADPGSSYRGGEMEPQPATAFVTEFSEALIALQPNQVSEVVETQFGFHIIELIEQRGDLYHCRHILLRPEYTTEELMDPINFLDSLAIKIRQDSITFGQAAIQYSDDASSKMNDGVVSNHDMLERYNAYDAKLTVTKFLKEDFGAMGYKSLDDYNALEKLKKGEISNAFTTEDMLGNPISKIVQLVELYPAHEASLEEDYIRLEGLALTAKQQKVFKSWLADKIASTYVFIDPEYRDIKFDNIGWVK